MKQFIAAAAILLASSGCLRSTTTISVKADGSGTVLQETGVSPQALAMMKGMSGGPGGGQAEFFGEEQAKKAAAMMGVEFLGGEPIKSADMEGYRARFAFTDIRKVQMRMNQTDAAGMSGAETGKESPFAFDFERKESTSLLTITVPDQQQGLGPVPKPPAGADAQQNQQALQMMKVMMKGLFVDVSLAVDGRIVKTNAPHVNGSTITLLQVDFDKLMADESVFQRLQGATDLKALQNVPGLKVVSDRTLNVEFVK